MLVLEAQEIFEIFSFKGGKTTKKHCQKQCARNEVSYLRIRKAC